MSDIHGHLSGETEVPQGEDATSFEQGTSVVACNMTAYQGDNILLNSKDSEKGEIGIISP